MTDEIEKLIKLAGPRAEIPHGIEQRTYAMVRQEWDAATQQPDSERIYKKVRRAWLRDERIAAVFRWSLPLGGVAAAILAIVVLLQPEPAPRIPVATVAKAIQPAAGEYTVGDTIFDGDLLSVGDDEGLSLLLARGESLRVDANTQLQIDGKDQFTLLVGRVYVDTGQFVYRDGGLRIETTLGTVTDVGTQFSVAAGNQHLDVAVREGRVDVSGRDLAVVLKVGEQMALRHGGVPDVSELAPNADAWRWVTELAPDFDIENRSLYDFLQWAARETGRDLVFENDELRMSAMREDIHGDVSNLTPNEALRAVQATTKLRYRVEEDQIKIEE